MKFEIWIYPELATKDIEAFEISRWRWHIRSVHEKGNPAMDFKAWQQEGIAPTREQAITYAKLMADHLGSSLAFMYDTDAQQGEF